MAAGHGGQVLLDGTTAGLCSSIDLIAVLVIGGVAIFVYGQ